MEAARASVAPCLVSTVTLAIAQYLCNGRPGLTFRGLLYYSGIVDLHRIYERVKRETELGDDAPDVHHCEVVDVLKLNGPCTELNKPKYCSKAC